MSTTTTTNVITAANVAAAAADLISAEGTRAARWAIFATSAFLTTDSLRKIQNALNKVGAVKYSSSTTLNRVQVVGSYLARDLSAEAVDGADDLYTAVIACTKKDGPGIVKAREAIDPCNTIGEAIAAVRALVEGVKAEAPEAEVEGEGEGDEEVTEAPADKSATYLKQAADALTNFTAKGTPTREHEGTLEIILAQVEEALALVRKQALPHGVLVAA